MPTIREVIEGRIKEIERNIQEADFDYAFNSGIEVIEESQEEDFDYSFNSGRIQGMQEIIIPLEEACQKRIEELEKKARVYDLIMEMPEGFTLYNHKLYKGDWYAQLDEHDEDFDTDDIVISGGKTPQDALEKLKEKLNLQK